jgi:putative heme-binding domain-containing protein
MRLLLFNLILVMTVDIAVVEDAISAEPNDAPVTAELDLLSGFRAQRLYQVPREQGSWVCMTFDAKGRMIVSHEGGGLYRVNPSPLGQTDATTTVEKLDVKIGGAQGLLYAFDSLYAMSGGVVRLRDTNGDDQFDSVEKILSINGRGEHGPHAIVLGPGRKWLYLIAGNQTALPGGLTKNRVAAAAGEKNHTRHGPQGWVMRIDPKGKQRELYSIGLRNSYGMAIGPEGNLFTFDSDNEGYMGLPWYRPTNIYHLVSGADFGWRQGRDTLQRYHPDNLPPLLEVGPGSPTGMVFGTSAKFPAKYQQAMFVGDWSYGRIYAIYLRPRGASFIAEQELFASGRPLAVTDLRIGPDGAMYFLTGGRGTQSALYRITWAGGVDADAPIPLKGEARSGVRSASTVLRRQLADFHGIRSGEAIETAWPHLRSEDRTIRYAARVAIEHQDVAKWQDRALSEKRPGAVLEAMIALARQADRSLQPAILVRISKLNWMALDDPQRLALLRAYELIFRRMGIPASDQRQAILAQVDSHYPNGNDDINHEIIKCLIDLKAPNLIGRTIGVIKQTPTAMRQIHFLLQLDRLTTKLDDEERKELADGLDLVALRDIAGRTRYRDVSAMMLSILNDVGVSEKPDAQPAKQEVVKEWTMDDLLPLVEQEKLEGRDLRKGQTVFRRAQCHNCHRIVSSGGVLGPNLTGLSGRYRPRDVLESIVDPDKVVPDQFRTTVFVKTDGKQFTGQIVNLHRGVIQIRLDPSRPFPRVSFPEKDIAEMYLSSVSLMPKGTLNSLTADEIQDLMAYLLRRN